MNIDGTYEIIEMLEWDKADIDLVEPGYIRIKGNRGELHFICVDGDMDIRKDKSGVYKFSWDGNDECDPASGFGNFTCDGDTLTGRIYIHDGDDSSFVAKKTSGNGLLPWQQENQPNRLLLLNRPRRNLPGATSSQPLPILSVLH